MKLFIFFILQWTWGITQNVVGGVGWLLLRAKHRSELCHGVCVTYVNTPKRFGGVSLGMFVFVNAKYSESAMNDIRIHEIGHCVQSMLLGPLYWFVVALPSVLWCNLPMFRKRHNTPETRFNYYDLYCEAWANRWGVKWTSTNFINPGYAKWNA
ncbi:MAG: hypothetical protein FWB76_04690 [Oscillospiraceae bacterium]|nr:hypothetical protein [Oscillospiraceae bacterium]